MNLGAAKRFFAQAAVLAGIWAACFLSGTPVSMSGAVLRVGVLLGAIHVFSRGRIGRGQPWLLALVWAFTILAFIVLAYGAQWWNILFCVAPFLLGTSAWLVSGRYTDPATRNRWRILASVWAGCAEAVLLGASYLANQPVAFYVAVATGVVLLTACKKVFQLRTLGIQLANTVILLLVGIPLASLLLYGVTEARFVPDPAKKYYSYEVASQNMKLYEHWGNSFWGQWAQVVREIVEYNPPGAKPPFRLKPDSHAQLIDSRIDINNRGFRGKDFAEDKGDRYRIVTLGESTTFAFTITATDRPWPERLEQLIHDDLKLRRPVEVINAGVFSFDLSNNVDRLSVDILALKPDMIISYHGLNGFHMIDSSLPSMFGRPPGYRRRPVMLLAEAEFKMKLLRFNRQRAAESAGNSAPPGDPMQSEYARQYRRLIQIAQSNHIRLVLANYSMAVNRTSDPKVKNFYRLTFPGVEGVIAANEAHTKILEQLAGEHPEICLANTHPNLDGQHDEYIDLVHFTEDGEKRMAENLFQGIKPLLESELSPGTTQR